MHWLLHCKISLSSLDLVYFCPYFFFRFAANHLNVTPSIAVVKNICFSLDGLGVFCARESLSTKAGKQNFVELTSTLSQLSERSHLLFPNGFSNLSL